MLSPTRCTLHRALQSALVCQDLKRPYPPNVEISTPSSPPTPTHKKKGAGPRMLGSGCRGAHGAIAYHKAGI